MRLCSIFAGVALLGCTQTASPAQTCCTRAPDTKCELRTSGPLSKAEIGEANQLIDQLSSTEKTKRAFYEMPDSGSAFVLSYKDQRAGIYYSGCIGCDDGSSTLSLGTNGEIRDMVNGILRQRIERITCRLRAIGVDVPRP